MEYWVELPVLYSSFLLVIYFYISVYMLNIYILLRYSWLTMFQMHSKVIQLYRYTQITFKIIFHHWLLQNIDYVPYAIQ